MCLAGDGRKVTVEMDYFFGDKPYLGGYRWVELHQPCRHRRSRREFHHAASQTEHAARAERLRKAVRSCQVQTRPEVDQQLQTTQEKVETPKLHLTSEL